MKTPMVREHNVQTGVILDREMNLEELEQYEKDKAETAAQLAKDLEAKEAKEAAQAKLAALGLTTEDLKALGL